jgi:hypothetical protein
VKSLQEIIDFNDKNRERELPFFGRGHTATLRSCPASHLFTSMGAGRSGAGGDSLYIDGGSCGAGPALAQGDSAGTGREKSSRRSATWYPYPACRSLPDTTAAVYATQAASGIFASSSIEWERSRPSSFLAIAAAAAAVVHGLAPGAFDSRIEACQSTGAKVGIVRRQTNRAAAA